MRRTARRALAVGGAVAALVGGITVPSAAGSPRALDGPGAYVLFRTLPAADAPTPEQDAGCDQHFGSERSSLTVRQPALSFVPQVDPTSGVAVDQTRSYIGPSYICASLGPTTDLIEAYGSADLPMGSAQGHGTCQASVLEFLRLAPFLGCRLELGPVPAAESPGGYLVTNSVSGSLVVGYLVRESKKKLPYTAPGPEPERGSLPNNPDFYVWRDFAPRTAGSSPTCQQAGAVHTSGTRTSSLSATQPDLKTGLLNPRERLNAVGSVTVCFLDSDGPRRNALAVAEIQRAGTTVTAYAQGDCREAPVPGDHAGLRVQTCALGVVWADSPLFRAGHVTSIGLVRADQPLVAANSHIWSLGILDGETESVPPVGVTFP